MTDKKAKTAKPLHISDDAFLWACLEYERTFAATHAPETLPVWPGLAALAQTTAHEALGVYLNQILEWAGTSHAGSLQRFSQHPISGYEDLSEALPFLAETIHSIVQLFDILSADSNHPEADPRSLRAKFFTNDAHNASIVQAFTGKFPNLSDKLMAYLTWCCADALEPEGMIGDRPPVGRYAPTPSRLRALNTLRHAPRRETRGHPAIREVTESWDSTDGDRPQRRRRDERGRSGPSNGASGRAMESDPQIEQTALDDVKAAIDRLKSQPQVHEVVLKPMNSFYRRIQHQMICDQGFFSQSVGSGTNRSVKATRTPQTSETNDA